MDAREQVPSILFRTLQANRPGRLGRREIHDPRCAAGRRRRRIRLEGITAQGVRMPFVTLTVRKPKSTEFKDKVFAAVHAALVATGVPDTDRFHRVLELDAADFRYDSH